MCLLWWVEKPQEEVCERSNHEQMTSKIGPQNITNLHPTASEGPRTSEAQDMNRVPMITQRILDELKNLVCMICSFDYSDPAFTYKTIHVTSLIFHSDSKMKMAIRFPHNAKAKRSQPCH